VAGKKSDDFQSQRHLLMFLGQLARYGRRKPKQKSCHNHSNRCALKNDAATSPRDARVIQGVTYVVRADEKLTAFMELEAAIPRGREKINDKTQGSVGLQSA